MTRTSLLLLCPIALLLSYTKLTAGDTGSIRCQAGEGYVYLYQSAENFQVLADLKCGQKVEIVGAQNNAMARVRTIDGKEGYIFKTALTAIVSAAQPQGTASSPAPSVITSQPAPAQTTKPPLTDGELMALVAGNALSENIVQESNSRGLAFRPSDQYRSLMETAGADAALIAALSKAKIAASGGGAANDKARDQLLQHLAPAGKLIRSKQFAEVSQELSEALQSGDSYEAGFVMGESLRQQGRWLEASAVYEEVLRRAPGFIQARTKWSYVLYRRGDQEDALQQAKIVLAQDPEDAEAHKNAGLALQVLQKFDASEQEYMEALRVKPDYGAVRYNLGILFYSQGKWDQAIAQYKKAVALDPNQPDWHNNLGMSYESKGDLDSAIREFREAKRLSPKDIEPRQNLGRVLMQHQMPGDAVAEMRELEAMAPDSAVCHECLANGLYAIGEWDEAAKEYHIAMQLDPSDITPYLGLGTIAEARNDYDGALAEYREAERINPTGAVAYRVSGRVLLAKKDPVGAAAELKRAELLDPADVDTHDMYGQALDATGDRVHAFAEYKQALGLDPKRADVRLRLAAVLEKNQNWVEALDQYRQAAINDQTQHGPAPMHADAQTAYKAAKERLDARIGAMKASGNSAAATGVKKDVRDTMTQPTISAQLDTAMLAGNEAAGARRFDEAEKSYKEAAVLAEKVQPHDDRLPTSLMRLAFLYQGRKDSALTEAAMQRYLKASEEVYGAQSPMMAEAYQMMAGYSTFKHDFSGALDYYQRAIYVNTNTFGESSDRVALSLSLASSVFMVQGAYDKAESYLLRALHIDEGLYGRDNWGVNIPLGYLCNVYDKWGKSDKAAPCYQRDAAIVEKQFGADSPVLLQVLPNEAKALRALGRREEAAKVEQRVESIRASTGASANFDPNGPPPSGPPPGGLPPTPNR
jgi:tetratricopeptide (TPR) repeat protein